MTEDRDPIEEAAEREAAAVASDGGALDDDDDAIEIARGSARDEDEQEADDELELDQTELEELGLVLDDPHQPDDE